MSKKPYYITTAIAYTSRKPHVGNTYEIVMTDAIARFKRLQGYDVYFLTGTDEHGQKIEAYAKEAGVSPKEYVDKVAGEIKDICDRLNTTYDRFIRTTDDDHVAAVQKIFKKFYDNGDIYKGSYSGNYCVACESFFTDSQLVDGRCPDCGKEVTVSSEEAYFFNMGKYQKRLEKYIEDNPDFIYPEARKNEMLNNFIRPGIQDLCVSRSSFKWGIPVPFDEGHVVYVWLDALSNYITALGYDPENPGELYKKYWPADLHIIGKDIVRFHTIYWPIFLMALGEELPKRVYGHQWLLFGEDKISKSKGNVIYADDLADLFGVDAVRYYLLSEMPFAQDGSITFEEMIERYNSDLANTLGNLVSRTAAMINKYFGGVLPCRDCAEELDDSFKADIVSSLEKEEKAFDELRIADAANAVIAAAKRSNKYIDETAPWLLARDENSRDRLSTVLYNLAESIRIIAVELSPFMPETSAKIFDILGTKQTSYESIKDFGGYEPEAVCKVTEPLFARVDIKDVQPKIDAINAKIAEATAVSKKALEIANAASGGYEEAEKIDIDAFAAVDLRVCEIRTCEPVKRSKKLLKLTVFDGNGERTVCSGIAQWYKPEDLIGRRVIVVANLRPAVLCGVESNGMILASDAPDGSAKVIFADDMTVGSKVR
ncbi:MAG: methionine--tRNA ligase [Clostridia bacterium]|nr:methionine--tRNA ligase [Clostridia bacterium]